MSCTERLRHVKQFLHLFALTMFTLLMMSAATQSAMAQWTTNNDDISNTNSGNVGIGTASPAHKVDLQAGSLPAGKSALNVTGTLSGTAGNLFGELHLFTTSTGSPSNISGGYFQLNPGYTGSIHTQVVRGANAVAGTSTTFGLGNIGVFGSSEAATTGNNVGTLGWAFGGNLNYGVLGRANGNKSAAVNIGVAGFGLNMATTSPIHIGGYFGLQDSLPAYSSAALMADSGSTSDPIFVGRAGGVVKFTLGSNGNTGIGTATPSYKLDVAGTVRSSSGGFVFPDGTVQLTAATGGGGNLTAGNISAGQFGQNTGGGNFSFPASVTIPAGNAIGFPSQNDDSGIWWGDWNNSIRGAGAFGPGLQFRSYGGKFNFIDSGSGSSFVLDAATKRLKLDNFEGVTSGGTTSFSGWNGAAGTAGGDTLVKGGDSATDPAYTGGNGGNIYVQAGKQTNNSQGHEGARGIIGFRTYTAGATATLTERMRIDADGKVGIGTSTPGYKLDVAGEINATGLRINGTPISTGGSSQWTTSGNNIYYNTGSGFVGIGTSTPGKTLDVGGDINASGTITGGNIVAKYQDVAEWVPSDRTLAAGTVVTLDPNKSNQVLPSSKSYDTKVAGVVSARPGLQLGEAGEGKVLVATTGRVKVKVDATRAPIHIGDLLVTGDKEGVAMKSEPLKVGGAEFHRPGTLIGKALEPLEKGTGEVLVLLSLQ